MKLLLAHGADASITDKDGYTPMMGAGYIGRTEVGKALLDHGLDMTAIELVKNPCVQITVIFVHSGLPSGRTLII